MVGLVYVVYEEVQMELSLILQPCILRKPFFNCLEAPLSGSRVGVGNDGHFGWPESSHSIPCSIRW